MQSTKRWEWTEISIYTILWSVLLFSPILVTQQDFNFNKYFYRTFIRILPFFVIFLINNYILVPKVFFKEKTRLYFLLTLAVVVVVVFIDHNLKLFIERAFSESHNIRNVKIPHPKMIPFHKSKELILLNNFVISLLVVGFNTALKLTGKWMADDQKRKDFEKENIESKLAFLRYQISPHFFMNTLNNIHALIDQNTVYAKDSIIRLSMLMRYLLYDSEGQFTMLSKEIEFINSYIDLMKLRLSKDVDITFEVDNSIGDFKVPPLLFVSFIENAYKHGISNKETSFINIFLSREENNLVFLIFNSRHVQNKIKDNGSGIGLQNTRKRLDLIYGNKYSLEIVETVKEFSVKLTLPI